jgi:hypothetical protein
MTPGSEMWDKRKEKSKKEERINKIMAKLKAKAVLRRSYWRLMGQEKIYI